MREGEIQRTTYETDIKLRLNLDGEGKSTVDTGIGFFDHMLTLFARHGALDLRLSVKGDLNVDGHHSVEDTGIVLGQAVSKALGDKAGIKRYGCAYVPMDEALARCVLDISGRGFLVYDVPEMAYNPGMDVMLAEEFFRAFAVNAGITLHISVLYGKNPHHMLEGMFKALGRALREAVSMDGRIEGVPSTKGLL